MSPVAIVEQYTQRAARAWDRHDLRKWQRLGQGAIGALHAAGLLTEAEQADALCSLVDTCARRAVVLAADESEGGEK